MSDPGPALHAVRPGAPTSRRTDVQRQGDERDGFARQDVLVIGRGAGSRAASSTRARRRGDVIVAGARTRRGLRPEVRVESVDLTDDASIDALAKRVGRVDHVVSTASARARGTISDLDRDAVRRSFDTKVIGPLMLARAFQHQINEGGSMLIFSGVAAFKIEPATLAVAITNGAADTLTRSLAVALAPIRVNAISPGVIDTGAWDALGETRKAELFADDGGTQPGAAHRPRGGRRRGGAARPDQSLHDRRHAPRRRRRTPHLKGPAMNFSIEARSATGRGVTTGRAVGSQGSTPTGPTTPATPTSPTRTGTSGCCRNGDSAEQACNRGTPGP